MCMSHPRKGTNGRVQKDAAIPDCTFIYFLMEQVSMLIQQQKQINTNILLSPSVGVSVCVFFIFFMLSFIYFFILK